MHSIRYQINKWASIDKWPIYKKQQAYTRRQSLPYDHLYRLVLAEINTLLNYSYMNVPFYKELFDKIGLAGKGGIQLGSLRELSAVPVLTKDDIRTQGERLVSLSHKSRLSYVNKSGGSTGEPVAIIQDKHYYKCSQATTLQAYKWRGMEPFDRMVKIWGAHRDTTRGASRCILKTRDFIRNRFVINCFKLDSHLIADIIKVLNKQKPKLIVAYTNAIYEIAKYARENNIPIEKQSAIHVSAGTLFDFMRMMIEDVFQCKVFNHYGGREVSSIASECDAHNGMHVMMEHNHVEIVKDDGFPCMENEVGDIIVTNLNNYSMPLIRYRIGDVGAFAEIRDCPCGCNYRKIKAVSGRAGDVLYKAGGEAILPEYFIHMIGVVCNRGEIGSFQVIQKGKAYIVIKIVPLKDFNTTTLDEIGRVIRKVMGEDCRVDFEFVEMISKTATGKHSYTIREM